MISVFLVFCVFCSFSAPAGGYETPGKRGRGDTEPNRLWSLDSISHPKPCRNRTATKAPSGRSATLLKRNCAAVSPLWEEFGLNIPGRRPRKAKASGSADATLIAVGKENAALSKAA